MNPDTLQFYVTPPALAARLWSKFKDRDFERVLDAFAGTGALGEAVPLSYGYGSRNGVPIDSIEIDGTKHPTLREKGHTVVGLDFFAFEGGEIYSHVVMNPPFAIGARAVLKAWDMLWEGEIAAIVNAESIRNPYTREREQLVRLIEEHGDVEYVELAFRGPDVERETDVEVALVHLVKPAEAGRDWIGGLIDSMVVDKNVETEVELPTELALPASFVDTQCAIFRAAVRAMREAKRAEAVAVHYAQRIGKTMAAHNGEAALKPGADIRRTIAESYSELKDRAWTSILRSTETLTRLSSSVQRQAEAQFETIKKLDFTEPNVYGFLLGLVQSQPEMQLDMACDVFDTITRYHSENTVYYRGWKSNDKHHAGARRIRTSRFIIPGHPEGQWSRHSAEWGMLQQLADFDKVFAMLDGKRQPLVSLAHVFQTRYDELRTGARVSTTYFDVRYYRGIGTIHFFARDKAVIDRLNKVVGRRRQWLPPEGMRVPETFWLQYEKAEALDKEVRAKVMRGQIRWDDPFRALAWDRSEDKERAEATILAAIDETLAEHGMTAGLEYETPDRLMLTNEMAASSESCLF
jgi:predicted RNA methylase